jgi:hypothetical protein
MPSTGGARQNKLVWLYGALVRASAENVDQQTSSAKSIAKCTAIATVAA